MIRIGILGGSFNPPTFAHLQLGVFSISQFNLDKVFVVPCSVTGFDKKSELTPEGHRFNMTSLAIKDITKFEILDFELFKNKPVFAFETLTYLKKRFADDDLFYISGSDSLATVCRWKNPEIVAGLVEFIVAPRGDSSFGTSLSELEKLNVDKNKIHQLEFPRNDLSSTIVRKRLKNNESCNCLIPKNVIDYIKLHALYQKEEDTETRSS